jgi:AraC-like DNA-binding protein
MRITWDSFGRGGLVIPFHWHEYLELIYVWEGSILACRGERRFELGIGELAVFTPNFLHAIYNPGGPIRYTCMLVDPDVFFYSGLTECSPITAGKRRVPEWEEKLRPEGEAADAFETMRDEYRERRPGWELALRSAAFRVLLDLFRNHVLSWMPAAEYRKSVQSIRRIGSALSLVERSDSRPITLSDAASSAGMSLFHFSRIFHEVTGQTFLEYETGFRLGKAKRLLKESALSVAEIAKSCGWEDPNYFGRLFRTHEGMSPGRWRLGTEASHPKKSDTNDLHEPNTAFAPRS